MMRLTYSGLGRVGPVSCQTSRIPGWEHWLNQPQEAVLMEGLPSSCCAGYDIKPVGDVHTQKENASKSAHST